MERNLCLIIEYQGTNYYGWQIQNHKYDKNRPTVQSEIEKALKKLFCRDIRINYAGRTDRGVHAKNQVVNFKTDTRIPLKNVKKALNSFLPPDINIKRVKFVPSSFHARFSVKSKIYRYLVLNSKKRDIFLRNFSWWITLSLDIQSMKAASEKIIGKKDFSVFAKQPGTYKTCVRTVKNIDIKKRGKMVYFDIEADGFLRGMVRNIISLLVSVGSHRIDKNLVGKIIRARDKSFLEKPALPQGLYLWKVFY